jgi:hypothetical protein
LSAVLDLGSLGGTLLVFGGPYSNRHATEAMRAEASRLGIPPERCLCTGDVVAYCAEPVETTALIRDWGCPVVMGNCEESLAQRAADCGCGFESGSGCDLLSRHWFAHAAACLDRDQRTWMGSRPRMIRLELAGCSVAVVHGATDRINRFIFASTPKAEKRRQADLAGTDIVLAGHSGLPFTQGLREGRLWHNPGVIGMPANDGDTAVWYSLIVPKGKSLRFEHRRLRYDHAGAAAAMRAAGLSEGYARALETGLWPSTDVLPGPERAATASALTLDLEPFTLDVAGHRPRKAPPTQPQTIPETEP